MLKREDLVILSNLSQLMAEKLKVPISHVCGWVKGRITIAIANSYSCMIHGDFLPSPLWDRDPDWYLVLDLGLAQ